MTRSNFKETAGISFRFEAAEPSIGRIYKVPTNKRIEHTHLFADAMPPIDAFTIAFVLLYLLVRWEDGRSTS